MKFKITFNKIKRILINNNNNNKGIIPMELPLKRMPFKIYLIIIIIILVINQLMFNKFR